MKNKPRQYAFSLAELLVVMAIIGLMLGLTMPSVNTMIHSHHLASVKTLIRSALTQAQVYAASNQKYAGLRFQQDLDGKQYVVLIEHEPKGMSIISGKPVPAYIGERYTAIPNAKPIALPASIGLITGDIDSYNDSFKNAYLADYDPLNPIQDPLNPTKLLCFPDATTFTVIFSPTGQLVVKKVGVRKRNDYDLTFGNYLAVNAPAPAPLLYYDNYNLSKKEWPFYDYDFDSAIWCVREDSTTSMYIYEMNDLVSANPLARYTDYVYQLEPLLINAYTGEIIGLEDLK